MSIRTSLRPALLLVLPTLAVCFAALELGLRLQGRLPSNPTDGIFEAHGSAYRLVPNQTKVSRTPSFACTIKTNALGLRDRETGPRALGRPYVAWAGDSATFANGVEYEESFVGVFGAAAERSGLEVVNLAVGGHHIAEQEELIQDFLAAAPRKPEAVVVVFTPQLLALFERRYERLVVKDGYIFERDRWLVPYLLVALNSTSSGYCFLRDGVRALQARWFPSAPGAAAEVLGIYERSFSALSAEATGRLERRVEALDARVRAAGAAPVHVYLPTTADLRAGELLGLSGRRPEDYDFGHYREALRRASERAGVRLLDLTAVLEAEHAKGKALGFAQDMHYNAGAHATIAGALVGALLEAPGAGVRTAPSREGGAPATTSQARR